MPERLMPEAFDGGVLFADLKGYSKLDETEMAALHERVLPALAALLFANQPRPKFRFINTWGDGIVLVGNDYVALATVALEIRNYFRYRKYVSDSDQILRTKSLAPRIAIHTGHFWGCVDPFADRPSFYGTSVILAARIEPVTPPGVVWITPVAWDRLKIQDAYGGGNRARFIADGRGPLQMAKEFGETEILELRYAADPPADSPVQSEGQREEGQEWRFDATRLERIRQALGIDPRESKYMCEQTLSQCQAQSSIYGVLAEVVRSAETVHETFRFALRVGDFLSQSLELMRTLDSGHHTDPEKLVAAVTNVRREIDRLRMFAEDLPRTYRPRSNWKKKHIRRLAAYTIHRTRLTESEQAKLHNALHVVNDAMSNEDPYDERAVIAQVSRPAFRDALMFLIRVFGSLENDLSAIVHSRCVGSGDALRGALASESVPFADKLDQAINRLPHNYPGLVPRIWAEA